VEHNRPRLRAAQPSNLGPNTGDRQAQGEAVILRWGLLLMLGGMLCSTRGLNLLEGGTCNARGPYGGPAGAVRGSLLCLIWLPDASTRHSSIQCEEYPIQQRGNASCTRYVSAASIQAAYTPVLAGLRVVREPEAATESIRVVGRHLVACSDALTTQAPK
jgi:hypothetical protein